ncbi:hypothetical protein ASL14_01780 [Paenibacillus sp. IHB B 3084]|uniref:fibronectin type III domain-containing protein n=1 Tax=Paenibacillus sp. IHB B 3084 TaxID=867076 RepID=UPI00071FFA85|nr:fibronectin type III domain-containing protein [Paenibacillus sp. IHB B 3084]ALP35096.1 hypothetical protein ASL14_01780 [Paenibacillus sp. IHB B 3084]
MKKIFGLILSITLLFVLLIPFSSVSAYSGGLANGKQAILSSTLWGEGESSLLATDNNNKTGISLKSQYLIIDLGSSYTVRSYRFDATGSIRWDMYNSAKGYIAGFGTSSYPMNGSVFQGFSPNSRYLVLSGTGTINELDVFTGSDVPAAAQKLNAVGGESKVTLSFDSVANATSYTVKRSVKSGGPYENIADMIKDTSFIDSNVKNGTTYYYVVTAVNDGGESTFSNEASATPKAVLIPDPNPTTEPKPSEPDENLPGDRAIVVVTMTTGLEKEFDLSMKEVNDFIVWYESKQAGSGPASYAINKHDNNKGPFSSRKDYMLYDRILTFEVSEYSK